MTERYNEYLEREAEQWRQEQEEIRRERFGEMPELLPSHGDNFITIGTFRQWWEQHSVDAILKEQIMLEFSKKSRCGKGVYFTRLKDNRLQVTLPGDLCDAGCRLLPQYDEASSTWYFQIGTEDGYKVQNIVGSNKLRIAFANVPNDIIVEAVRSTWDVKATRRTITLTQTGPA